MRKIWFILPFLFLSVGALYAQEDASRVDDRNLSSRPELPKTNPQDEIITHQAYTISFNKASHVANWVAYELTAGETVAVVKRNNKFISDPLLTSCTLSNADYEGSGYDKGHLAPSADMCFSYETMVESFYLSNMSPQDPGFNRGIWSKLEKQVRQWAIDNKAVYVVTGTVLSKGFQTIGSNGIAVPSRFYKVILDFTGTEIKGIGFIMANEGSKEPLQHFAVTIDSVERVTGTDFFFQLPDDQEKSIEGKVDISKWSWTAAKSRSSKK